MTHKTDKARVRNAIFPMLFGSLLRSLKDKGGDIRDDKGKTITDLCIAILDEFFTLEANSDKLRRRTSSQSHKLAVKMSNNDTTSMARAGVAIMYCFNAFYDAEWLDLPDEVLEVISEICGCITEYVDEGGEDMRKIVKSCEKHAQSHADYFANDLNLM